MVTSNTDFLSMAISMLSCSFGIIVCEHFNAVNFYNYFEFSTPPGCMCVDFRKKSFILFIQANPLDEPLTTSSPTWLLQDFQTATLQTKTSHLILLSSLFYLENNEVDL